MKILAVLLVTVPGMLAAASRPSAAPRQQVTPILEDTLSVTPVNAGINPNAFAIEIAGKVQLGGNPCMARGVTARFKQRRRGERIEVEAILKLPAGFERRVCTMEYNPVVTEISTTVRSMRQLTNDIIIKNVGKLGIDVSALTF